MTAPPAPAPDDLIARLDAAIEAKWARWALHFNRDDYLDFMRSELAARDAEIERLREAVVMLRSFGCPICNGDCAVNSPPVLNCPMQIARDALAAERTQDTP